MHTYTYHIHIRTHSYIHTHAVLGGAHIYFGGNLVIPIIAHAMYDFAAVIYLLYFPPKHLAGTRATATATDKTVRAEVEIVDDNVQMNETRDRDSEKRVEGP
jgi:hypothetical protein